VYEASEETVIEEELVTHPQKARLKVAKVPAPPQTVVTEEKTYVTIRKKKETLALKEPDTTREVFPELKSHEASLEIPEPPSAKDLEIIKDTIPEKQIPAT
uniref:Titin n=1 Tax=Peromyscus maniculatus bairdii TaxID=230844 RepID=A0A8C8TSA9_PERMB